MDEEVPRALLESEWGINPNESKSQLLLGPILWWWDSEILVFLHLYLSTDSSMVALFKIAYLEVADLVTCKVFG